jgi:hypothetical protein
MAGFEVSINGRFSGVHRGLDVFEELAKHRPGSIQTF